MKPLLLTFVLLIFTGCTVIHVRETPPPASDGKRAVCHKGKKTLYLPPSAVEAHLKHGDTLGPCP